MLQSTLSTPSILRLKFQKKVSVFSPWPMENAFVQSSVTHRQFDCSDNCIFISQLFSQCYIQEILAIAVESDMVLSMFQRISNEQKQRLSIKLVLLFFSIATKQKKTTSGYICGNKR